MLNNSFLVGRMQSQNMKLMTAKLQNLKILGTLTTVSDGMQYGWSAPVIPILLGKNSPVPCTESQAEWTETTWLLGAFSGLPVTIYLVNKIGRKNLLLLASCISIIVWILIAVADKIEYIFIARFFSGMSSDMAYVAAPMYIAEIADQNIRGFLSSVFYIMVLVGILLIYSVAPFVPFFVPSIIGAGLAAAQIVFFSFMPESPYYLLTKGKPERAKASLLFLRQNQNIEMELKEIAAAVERQKSEKGRPQDLFLVKSNRKAILIMTVLNAAQHFSSFSVLLMNMHMILEAAGSIYMKSTTAAILFAAIMLAAAAIASLFIDKYGRKLLLTTSSIFTGLCLLVIAIYFTLKDSGVDMDKVSWLPILFVMVYACVFKLGLGMVPIVMTAELFPTTMKAIGMTLADAIYVIFSIISLQIYQLLTNAYGIYVPFYIFSCSCFLTALFSAFVIPETKGKTLDEIQHILKGSRELSSVPTYK